MSFSKIFVAITSIAAITVEAASNAVASLPLASSCTDIKYDPNIGFVDGWLTASCLSGQGDTRIKSAVYLKNKINVNHDAKTLQWKSKNSDANLDCNYCDLASDAILSCRVCSDNASPTSYFPAQIDLAEHIANYDGHLLSDLAGTPTVPTNNPVELPEEFFYALKAGGLSTDVSQQVCGADPYGSDSLPGPDVPEVVSCLINPDWTFERLSTIGSLGAYEVLIFDNSNCSGTPFQQLTDVETCTTLLKPGSSVQVRMQWNGDVSGASQ